MTDLSKLDEAAFNSEVTKHLPSLDSLPQHRMTKAKAMEIAKCDLLFNGLGWELTSEKGDYKAYKLQLKGMTYPFVKGENIFIGETIERISTWIQSTKRRSICIVSFNKGTKEWTNSSLLIICLMEVL
jgi:hypothetical protein